MLALIRSEISKNGYIFLPAYCPEANIAAIAWALGQAITPWEGGMIQELVPRAHAAPNTYSGIFGIGTFPFHTDLAHWYLPPRYLMLRCVRGFADVQTLLLDGRDLINIVTLDVLNRAIYRPRRPRDGALTLLRLCEPVDIEYRLRWDEIFLKPASRVGIIADQRVREYIAASKPVAISLAAPGDLLLIDNWRMLHARDPVPRGRENRKIERMYLEDLN